MYVCICNAVTEDDVRSCVAAGAGSAKAVRAAFGMQPGCGTCTRRLCALVSQGRTAAQLTDALGTADALEAAATAVDVDLTADRPTSLTDRPATRSATRTATRPAGPPEKAITAA
jgi:bacterioferritin-associated ferredoxin